MAARGIELVHANDDGTAQRPADVSESAADVQNSLETPPVEADSAGQRGAAHSIGVSERSEIAACQFDEHITEIPLEERRSVDVAACPVCGGVRAVPVFVVAEMPYRVVVCDGCGLGGLDPRPTREAIASFYPSEYYGTAGAKFKPLVEALVRLVGSRHVSSFVRGLSPGARVLDVGCGRGVLLSALADRGFETHGFEISRTATEGADPRAEIRIAGELRDAQYPASHFDEVILWHVLEHLPEPRETLGEIHRILKPGGRLVVSVPNFSSLQAQWAGAAWFHLDLPRHLFHFPLSALLRMMTDSGFDCSSVHHFSLRQNPFGWVQSFLNRRRGLPRNGLYRMLKQTVEAGRPALFNRATRAGMLAAYYFGMPPALAASVLAALLRRGASVYVTAHKRR